MSLCVYLCLCVSVCDIKSEYQQNPHYVPDISRLDALLLKLQARSFLYLSTEALYVQIHNIIK